MKKLSQKKATGIFKLLAPDETLRGTMVTPFRKRSGSPAGMKEANRALMEAYHHVDELVAENERLRQALSPPAGARKGDWIQTFTGKKFWPLDPRAEDLDIRDIAHALSLVNRFNGHTRWPMSVAQHSLLVTCLVDESYQMTALLHDASEAYLGGLTAPVKRFMPEYRAAEDRLMGVVAKRYGILWPLPEEVKKFDLAALMTEARDLLPGGPVDWACHAEPSKGMVNPIHAEVAEDRFLKRFEQLSGEVGIGGLA